MTAVYLTFAQGRLEIGQVTDPASHRREGVVVDLHMQIDVTAAPGVVGPRAE
jgi:hypothetical protein